MVSYLNKNTKNIYGGESTDNKPVNVSNCAVFIEMDTGKIYMYSEKSKAWLEQKNLVIAY